MQKLIQEQKFKNSRTSTRFLAGLITILVILSIAKVFVANWLVESSETLRHLDRQIDLQSKENQTIAENLRESTALVKIIPIVSQQGFTKSVKISFVLPEKNVALNSPSVSPVR